MTTTIAKVEETTVAVATPADLLRIAVESNADIDKLAKLMELQERWEAKESKKAYIKAISRFREDCPEIPRTRPGHNSKYSGLAETIELIGNAMSDNGLSHSWETTQNGTVITVTCRVTHVAGHTESTSLSGEPDKSGSKNSIQAVGSTVSYLQRYTLFALLGLASREMDNDGGSPVDTITDDQANEIHAKITENGIDMDQFLAWLKRAGKVDSIAEINARYYDNVIRQLDAIIKGRKQ